MGEKRLVPKRRYKGYENSKPLIVEYLGVLTDIKTGPFGSSLHAKDYVEDGIPIITTEHFKEGYLPKNKKGIPQVSNEDYLRLNAYKLQSGDIVFSRVGSVDINALTTRIQKGWLFSGRVLRVRPQNQLSSLYLHYLLDTKRVKEDVIARAVGQTMPSINTEILKETRIIKTDNYKEQQKIGNFFNVLDERIANQERKIAKVKALKAAYLSEMFPREGEIVPKRRFKGYEREWEQRKLGEVINWSKGSRLSKAVLNDKKVGTEVIHYADLYKFPPVVDDVIHWSVSGEGTNIPKNSLLFPMSDVTPIGLARTSTITKEGVKASGDTLIGFLNKHINAEFMSYQINENKRDILPFVTGTTVRHISSSSLNVLNILITNLEEQIQISTFFKNLDNQIATEKSKLDKLKKMKEAYLEEMFV